MEETGRTPKLLVDIHNAGKLTFMGFMSTETGFAIRVDGKWYHWLGGTDVKSSIFDPGSVYRTSVDLSDRSWGSLSDRGNLSLGIDLLSGNHSVQVAIWLQELSSRRCIWITSNTLHVTLAGR
jgi:hypothetical protein